MTKYVPAFELAHNALDWIKQEASEIERYANLSDMIETLSPAIFSELFIQRRSLGEIEAAENDAEIVAGEWDTVDANMISFHEVKQAAANIGVLLLDEPIITHEIVGRDELADFFHEHYEEVLHMVWEHECEADIEGALFKASNWCVEHKAREEIEDLAYQVIHALPKFLAQAFL